MSEIYDKFHDLGAFVNGGQPRRTVPLPPPPVPKPAQPTTTMTVQGLVIEPAARLQALAAVRDRHRAAARFASDQMHALREKISEREQRVRFLAQTAQPGYENETDAQIAVIEAEISQLRAAMQAAGDEADDAAEAAGQADRLFRTARDFAVQHGAVIPLHLAKEAL